MLAVVPGVGKVDTSGCAEAVEARMVELVPFGER